MDIINTLNNAIYAIGVIRVTGGTHVRPLKYRHPDAAIQS